MSFAALSQQCSRSYKIAPPLFIYTPSNDFRAAERWPELAASTEIDRSPYEIFRLDVAVGLTQAVSLYSQATQAEEACE